MIFFIINKNLDNSDYYKISNEIYEIPVSYQELTNDENKLNEYNCQLISWNQAKYTNKEGKTTEIKTVKDLFSVVLEVARGDDVCKEMNRSFETMYLQNSPDYKTIDNNNPRGVFQLFNEFLDRRNQSSTVSKEDEKTLDMLFETIYDCWPDPLIGNIANSPNSRPRNANEQFEKWNSIQDYYMSKVTKQKIRCLLGLCNSSCPNYIDKCQLKEDYNYLKRENAGLQNSVKLGRDQVRICKDWTELARAVFGEITSYISKMLEKIYALELCQSKDLLDAQKRLLNEIINKKDFLNGLKHAFNSSKVEYTSFYYNMLFANEKGKKSFNWDIFALFIYSILLNSFPK